MTVKHFITPDWKAPKNIHAYTTLRAGWGNYADPTSNHDDYTGLMKLFNLPNPPIKLNQVHGSIVVEACNENRGRAADASITSEKNQVCMILTADCLPLLICNKQGTEVAAIHAGWRGLSQGIIENTLASLQSPASELFVWLGPAIGPNRFEVGEDVYQAFTQTHPTSTRAFLPHTPGKWLANLYELARMRLHEYGVNQITGGQYCTHTQEDLFFSYRRDHGKCGRMASVIWLADEFPSQK